MSLKQIVIPARAGSKGWVHKNRELLPYTLDIIPPAYKKYVLVSTDDDQIYETAKDAGVKVEHRDPRLATDKSDIKGVLTNIGRRYKFKANDLVIMLYLTYPKRDWNHINEMYLNFASNGYQSSLCRQPVLTHPCLTMFEAPEGRGIQVLDHDLYQRQQYPTCFEISHYICMYRHGELKYLNKNMYNEHTHFYNIDRCVDIDYKKDYNQMLLLNEKY